MSDRSKTQFFPQSARFRGELAIDQKGIRQLVERALQNARYSRSHRKSASQAAVMHAAQHRGLQVNCSEGHAQLLLC
jgi:hypothetical protein